MLIKAKPKLGLKLFELLHQSEECITYYKDGTYSVSKKLGTKAIKKKLALNTGEEQSMSKPTKEELNILKRAEGDDESYHGKFDDLIEAKLMQLDAEQMKKMQKVYDKSNMSRWGA